MPIRRHSAFERRWPSSRQVERPFSWWVGPGDRPSNLGDLLVDAGLLRAETELAMAADLAALQPQPVPAGLEIRRVRTPAELEDFAQVIAGPLEQHFYALAAAALLAHDSPQWFYIGYLDGRPVATAELTVGGGVAGLYNVSNSRDLSAARHGHGADASAAARRA